MAHHTCVDERELAASLKLQPEMLRKWRLLGRGPEFVRLGRAIRYRVIAVETWLAARPRGGEGTR